MARPPPDPWGKPAGIAMVGKGKGKAYQPTPLGDPWSGMVAGSSKGMGKGKGDSKGKGKEGKGDGKRPAAACTRCGGFFICQKAAEGKGLGPEHCTNPRCERSLEFARLGLEDKKAFLAVNLALRESEAAAARLAATRAEADAVSAGVFAQPSAAAAAATPGAAAPVVIDVDAHFSPLSPPGAAAAAGQSDTDVSSPAGEPVDQAARAPGSASRRPPTKDPSPAQMAAMAVRQPDRRTAGQMLAGAAEAAAALAALWEPTLPAATHVQMMAWAAAEIASSRAAAQPSAEALGQARDALAAAEDQVRQLEQQAVSAAHQSALVSWDQQTRIAELQEQLAGRPADEGSEICARQQRKITQLEQEAASLRARVAQLATALDAAVEAMQTAKGLANSLLDF